MEEKTEQGLFGALEKELRASADPLDCATLFDRASIRAHAATVNRVSDYLVGLWRKGLVTRLPAGKMSGTRARWLYAWKDKSKPEQFPGAIDYTGPGRLLLNKPCIEIIEDGGTIRINTLNFEIIVRTKTS